MLARRSIKVEETNIIIFLLERLGLESKDYPITDLVEEYEGYIMGSIGLGDAQSSPYAGDLIQARYRDADGKDVLITLTMSENGKLLDLDFWKEDFSKLLIYPEPKDLFFDEL